MKLITRNSDYGIRAVCFMACEKGRMVPVPELVKKLSIPRPFLRKILQVLRKKGIVRSYKGIGGGFKLARGAEDIRLVELVAAFQGPLKINECIFKKELCPNRARCALKKKIDGIEKYVVSELNSITINDLMKK
jgi:Rrf2 family protein